MNDEKLLEIKGLKKHFPIRKGMWQRVVGYVKAVDDVDLTIQRGETLSLVGESGSGKTTLGRCIVRAYKPTAGQIIYHETDDLTHDLHKLHVHVRNSTTGASEGHTIDFAKLSRRDLQTYRNEIQMIFQDPFSSLNPRMTLFEIIGEPLWVHGEDNRERRIERVAELLELVGLPSEYMHRFPHAFSGGQRQRIGIARALALNPSLVVADEPVSALDVSVQAQILNLMLELQNRLGLTYLFIAHDLSVVRHISHRIAVMYVGKLVEVAENRTLFERPLHPYTEALMAAVPKPDPLLRSKRAPLQGEVADPSKPPPGCVFHPRCRYAEAICRTDEPLLRELEPGHYVRCHLAEQLDLQGVLTMPHATTRETEHLES